MTIAMQCDCEHKFNSASSSYAKQESHENNQIAMFG